MSGAGEPPSGVPEVVRATRLELVDADGRVRMVLGSLTRREGSEGYGAALLDRQGRTRAWLSLEATGPSLVFDHAGNALLHVGVNDPTPDAMHQGAFAHLSDHQGRPVLSCQVEADGSLSLHLPGTTDP